MSPKLDPATFGRLVGKHREARGLSQTALARAAGISRPYLSQVESGKRMPSDEVMQRLLILSGIPATEFVDSLRAALTADQAQAISVLTKPLDDLSENLEPEQVLRLLEEAAPLEKMLGAFATLAGTEPPAPSGPDGWLDLSAGDRTLVQRFVNRLLRD